MKQRTFFTRWVLPLAIGSLAFGGCKHNDGEIPYNKDRAAKHVIPLAQGIALQNNFIAARAELGKLVRDSSFLTRRLNLSNAETFNRDAIALLLNQPGADGVRIYMGTDRSGKVRLVLVPVDGSGKDIIRELVSSGATIASSDVTEGVPAADTTAGAPRPEGESKSLQVEEMGQICPPCKLSSPSDR